MESVLSLIGAICGIVGVAASVAAVLVSVFIIRWQAREHAKELAQEREERAKEREAHAKELAKEREELARSNRLAFLSDRIFDISIPRELRLPFYEEYISMKGNGTAVKFWLMEGEMHKKR